MAAGLNVDSAGNPYSNSGNLSSVTCQLGVFAAEKGDVVRLRLWFMITFLMGAFFIGGQIYEYSTLVSQDGLTLASNPYGSVFYLTTGFHGLHVTGGVLYLVSTIRWVSHRPDPRASYNAVEILGLYWHFVDLVWIFLFPVLYLL